MTMVSLIFRRDGAHPFLIIGATSISVKCSIGSGFKLRIPQVQGQLRILQVQDLSICASLENCLSLGRRAGWFQNSDLGRWIQKPHVVGQMVSHRPSAELGVSMGERPAHSPHGCPRVLVGGDRDPPHPRFSCRLGTGEAQTRAMRTVCWNAGSMKSRAAALVLGTGLVHTWWGRQQVSLELPRRTSSTEVAGTLKPLWEPAELSCSHLPHLSYLLHLTSCPIPGS